MAANLTPQYLEAEAKYRAAKTPAEELAALEEMWRRAAQAQIFREDPGRAEEETLRGAQGAAGRRTKTRRGEGRSVQYSQIGWPARWC